MAQEILDIQTTAYQDTELHEALTKCEACSKIVPKTMLCLYCGSPILYKNPERE